MRLVWMVFAGWMLALVLLRPVPAAACSPAPWTFEDAYAAKAMIYGTVVDVGRGGRLATVDVDIYAGPGPAPKRVTMPETVDDRDRYPAGFECPDFSMKFRAGTSYVFFLKDIPPRLELLSPSFVTASLAEDGHVVVGLPRGETEPVAEKLQEYAERKGYALRTPEAGAPVWGEDAFRAWRRLAALAAGGAALAAYAFVRRRRNRP
ncbi:hypothetical protein [Paenibacillus sp.]|uniref:hypothetical protein n=1 Tax=Paenibacillus sp. TaxID=58172 RepID=UPI002D5B28B3|nr:hypothetical protein [Paenibacillus sp.]HZG85641.1 hypothetical protein [Paenibacillus sp.]